MFFQKRFFCKRNLKMKEIKRTFIFSKQKLNNYLFSINGTFVNLKCNAFLIKGHLKPGRQQGYNAEVYESFVLQCTVSGR